MYPITDLAKFREFLLNDADGHTIFKSKTPFGLDLNFIAKYTEIFRSDMSDPKSTIFMDGKMVGQTTGVYSLHLLIGLADHFNLPNGGHLFGRGSRARVIIAALLKEIENGNIK